MKRVLVRHVDRASDKPTAPAAQTSFDQLLRLLIDNQCRTCLGYSAGTRAIAQKATGRPAHIRECVCDIDARQGRFDFGATGKAG